MRARGRSRVARWTAGLLAAMLPLTLTAFSCACVAIAEGSESVPGAASRPPSCADLWYVTFGAPGPATYGRLDKTGAFVEAGALPVPSAALAVDAARPWVAYLVGTGSSGPDGILRRLDLDTGVSAALSGGPAPMFVTNRLATAPDGSLWSLTVDGHLWSTRPVAASIGAPKDHGPVSGSVLADGGGGDIAFDGLGNLWLLTNAGRLYSLPAGALGNPAGALRLVAATGVSNASGLAFAADGTLLTASSGASGSEYRVAAANGTVVRTPAGGPHWVGDLAGCSFPRPTLTAAKSAVPASAARPGATIDYTIGVRNSGTVPAMDAVLRDEIPAHTSYVQGSTRLNGSSVPDRAGSSPLGAGLPVNSPGAAAGMIAPGSVATVNFAVRVGALSPTGLDRVVNQGAVFFGGGPESGVPTDDPGTPAPDDPTVVMLRAGAPQLSVSKWADRSVARPGDRIRYTILVQNRGDASFTPARPARVVDDLSSILRDVVYAEDEAASGGSILSYSVGTLAWVGSLRPGQVVRISYSVTVRGDAVDTRIVNSVTADAGNCRPPTSDPRCSTVVRLAGVRAAPVVPTFGSDLSGPLSRGQVVEFWITLWNAGRGPALSVLDRDLTCVAGRGLIGQSSLPTSAALVLEGRHVVWSGMLAGEQSVRLGYSVTVLDPSIAGCLSTLATGGPSSLAQTGAPDVSRAIGTAALLMLLGVALCLSGGVHRPRSLPNVVKT